MATAGTAITVPASAMLTKAKATGLLEDEEPSQKTWPNGKPPKVLLVNGSPRTDGNTFCCLKEIETQLKKHGVASEIVQIGRDPVRMCINCGGCRQTDGEGCVFDDDICAVITQKMKDSDALIVGSPVYYGQPNGAVLSLIQRMFISAGSKVQNKPAAAVAVCRRGGATAAFQTLNMPFMLMNMPVVPSQYWNIVYGREPGQAAMDTEGMQTMRTLANNMATMLKATGGKPMPGSDEPWEPMHFIR